MLSGVGGVMFYPMSAATAILLVSLLVWPRGAVSDQDMVQVSYGATSENFPNPERGFYRFAAGTPTSPPLDVNTLRSYRDQGQTLVFRPYLIRDFRESDISEEFLDRMRTDFQTLRETGLKTLFKFRYSTAIGQPDADKARVFSHLAQLAPLFREYHDVIAVAQAGFIGAWGEWHASTNGLDTPDNMRDILLRVLEVLPAERFVQIRSPRHKMNIFRTNLPFPDTRAFDGSPVSRTGFHNDCFLASPTDVGTYQIPNYPVIDINGVLTADWIKSEYLARETRFVPMGGETCDPRPDAGDRYHCPSALRELDLLNWSFLNYNYSRRILDTWVEQGCMREVERRLGYRLAMRSGSYSRTVAPGGTFHVDLEMVNEGFAAPYNPREVQVVLRRVDNPEQVLKVNVPDRPRYWLGGEVIRLRHDLGIPGDLPGGEYDVLLNLPDPAGTLRNRPEFSVRLANAATWEASTGFNRLNHRVIIDASARGSAYRGDLVFTSR
jgi:hypothetical protein